MLVIAALGLLVSLVAVIVGWRVLSDLQAGVDQSLELTAGVLETVDGSFAVAQESFAILEDGVGDAEGVVRALGRSLAGGQVALEAATALTGGEVADTIERVAAGLPPIQSAADAIDSTLRTISQLPLVPTVYDPAQSLGASVGALRDQLDTLPDELRAQAAQVAETSGELAVAAEGTAETADALAELQLQLAEAQDLLADATGQAADAQRLVDEQRESLAGSVGRAKLLVVLLALVFASGQFVPLYLGWSLLVRDPGSDVFNPTVDERVDPA